MSHVPPPWIIEEVEKRRRERTEREQPRLEMPLPPPPTRSGEEETDAPRVIVIDLGAAGALTPMRT